MMGKGTPAPYGEQKERPMHSLAKKARQWCASDFWLPFGIAAGAFRSGQMMIGNVMWTLRMDSKSEAVGSEVLALH